MAELEHIIVNIRREINLIKEILAESEFRSDVDENCKFVRIRNEKLTVLCGNFSVRNNADFDAEFVVSANGLADSSDFVAFCLLRKLSFFYPIAASSLSPSLLTL